VTLRIIDLTEPPPADDVALPGVVVAVGPVAGASEYWLAHATFTLTQDGADDWRAITVDSVPDSLVEISERCRRWPQASAVCDEVLRSFDPDGPTLAGVVTDVSGRVLTFTVMSNNAGPTGRTAIDALAATLRSCGCGS